MKGGCAPAPGMILTAPTITVAGVSFDASQVKSAVLLVDGREVTIGEKPEKKTSIGFQAEAKT